MTDQLDKHILGFESQLTEHRTKIETIQVQLGQLNESMKDLTKMIKASGALPWGHLLSGMIVIMTIMGAFGIIIRDGQDNNRIMLDRLYLSANARGPEIAVLHERIRSMGIRLANYERRLRVGHGLTP